MDKILVSLNSVSHSLVTSNHALPVILASLNLPGHLREIITVWHIIVIPVCSLRVLSILDSSRTHGTGSNWGKPWDNPCSFWSEMTHFPHLTGQNKRHGTNHLSPSPSTNSEPQGKINKILQYYEYNLFYFFTQHHLEFCAILILIKKLARIRECS